MSTGAVLILPAELKDAGNALSIALGYDVEPGATYSVPLWTIADPMPTHEDAPSHYGCHAYAEPEFMAIIQAAAGGQYPEGVDAEVAAPVISALIASFDIEGAHESARDHFDAVLAVNNLVRIIKPLDEAGGA